ncbi:MAG: class IV adenylate cyclase [Patescibacteria group bacterium]
MKNREVEIRFRLDVSDRARMLTALTTKGWTPVASSQTDVYFCSASFVDEGRTKECPYVVRVRTQNGSGKVAYKSFTGDGSWVEIESSVGDPLAMQDILAHIGQRAYLTICKNRMSGRIGDIEINVDDIDGLGTFVEMELLSPDVEAARATLCVHAKDLGLHTEHIVTEGYVQLIEATLRP